MSTLELDRERVIQTLCSHYAHDQLSTQELEARFDLAYKATNTSELQQLVAGLPALAPALAVPAPGAPIALEGGLAQQVERRASRPVAEEKRHFVMMSEYKRRGEWTPPRRTVLRVIMGSALIDLREATFEDPEVEIEIFTMMGEVKIIVPPWIRVESDGTAFMGEFDQQHSAGMDRDSPVVHITGTTFMGTVVVKTRLPGESAIEAWRRRLRDGSDRP